MIKPRRVERARDRKKRNRSTLYGESTDKTMNKILSTHLTPSSFLSFILFISSLSLSFSLFFRSFPRRHRLRCLDYQILLPPPFLSPPLPPSSTFSIPFLFLSLSSMYRRHYALCSAFSLLFVQTSIRRCRAKRPPPLSFTSRPPVCRDPFPVSRALTREARSIFVDIQYSTMFDVERWVRVERKKKKKK